MKKNRQRRRSKNNLAASTELQIAGSVLSAIVFLFKAIGSSSPVKTEDADFEIVDHKQLPKPKN